MKMSGQLQASLYSLEEVSLYQLVMLDPETLSKCGNERCSRLTGNSASVFRSVLHNFTDLLNMIYTYRK